MLREESSLAPTSKPRVRARLRLMWRVVFTLLVLLCLDIFLLEPNWVEYHAVDIPLARLPGAFDGYRIIQLSDVHFSSTDSQKLHKVVREINALDADLIVLTGDYVTRNPETIDVSAPILARLHARDGVVAILGNHDHWTDPERIASTLQHHGIRVMVNESHAIIRHGTRLWIAGIDSYSCGRDNSKRALRGVPAAETCIMLIHEPDYADIARSLPVDLQLSGHSHGGQIRLPFIGGLIYPPYAQRYPMGSYQLGKLTLYTNRGLGHLAPMRVLCRPEVTIHTIKAPTQTPQGDPFPS